MYQETLNATASQQSLSIQLAAKARSDEAEMKRKAGAEALLQINFARSKNEKSIADAEAAWSAA